MKYALAIDIGASSGRHILGWMENGELRTEEISRCPNGIQTKGGHDVWDPEALFSHILAGMKRCGETGRIPATVGIDTWGVDYVLIDAEGKRIGDAVSYRDARTEGMDRVLEEKLPYARHYALTGTAKQPFNTVYQLMAEFREHPERREAGQLLFMPCYLSFLLCGKAENEYTIASTSGLLNAETKDYDLKVLEAAGIPASLLGGKPKAPGTVTGELLPEIAEQVGYSCRVVLTASHDTASAFRAIPFDPDSAILSSGTWSLLGTILEKPCRTQGALEAGFTNEGAVKGIRFLKNIMGLWMLQCIRKEQGEKASFAEMAETAAAGSTYPYTVDVADSRFLNPPSMTEAVLSALREHGAPLPEGDSELLYCVNHSLAASYAKAIREMEILLGKPFSGLTIVGGGNRNGLLNRLTEQETGLKVRLGPSEGTAEGNLLTQLLP